MDLSFHIKMIEMGCEVQEETILGIKCYVYIKDNQFVGYQTI